MTRVDCYVRVLSCIAFTAACGSSAESEMASAEQTAREGQGLASSCGIAQPAFCDSFDAPAGTGDRAGQLNGIVWGVSRAGGFVNFGQGEYNAWGSTALVTCNGTTTVQPPNDVIVCNGQVRQAVNDMEGVTNLAMYPKQPFDFTGRTGVVTFDVSNDTTGSHGAWPEFWISDKPVPTPFAFQGNWEASPQHGLGIRFHAAVGPNQGAMLGPNCPNDGKARWTVGSAVVVRNYVVDDQEAGGTIRAQVRGCVTRASGPGQMNHVELRISTSQIDVYATDAGTTTPLKHIAVVPNANLSFSRGLIWVEDVHYNAAKGGGTAQHTFAWDNVGFDGPILARDVGFDALDALTPVSGRPGVVNLGWASPPRTGKPFPIHNVSGIASAPSALLTFNFFTYDAPPSLTYVVNGHTHSQAWPFPENRGYTWRTLAVPVPLSELVTGTNTINVFASSVPLVISNADIILVAAGGVVAP
jgi:hypothetical protein